MNRLSLLASLALLTALAGTSRAANLEGETLHTLRAYPDVLTPFGPAIPDATVVAGTALSFTPTGAAAPDLIFLGIKGIGAALINTIMFGLDGTGTAPVAGAARPRRSRASAPTDEG